MNGKRAVLANDGQIALEPELCTSTIPGLFEPWWTIDLRAIFTFYGVILFVHEILEPGKYPKSLIM